MTRLALAVLLSASACTAPAEAPRDAAPRDASETAPSFDAAAWLARARPAAAESPMDADPDDPRLGEARTLVTELDAAVDWTTACGTYWDPEAQRTIVEREPVDGGHFMRGTYTVHDVGPSEAVVAVTCDFGAYQGSYALIHISGERAALLAAPAVDEAGDPYGPPSAVYSTPTFDGPDTFTILGLARGLGDCGSRSRYRIASLGAADLVEVRARGCEGDPEAAPPAEAWPVVFPK